MAVGMVDVDAISWGSRTSVMFTKKGDSYRQLEREGNVLVVVELQVHEKTLN